MKCKLFDLISDTNVVSYCCRITIKMIIGKDNVAKKIIKPT